MKLKRFVVILFLVSFSILAAACGGSQEGPEVGEVTDNSGPANSDTSTAGSEMMVVTDGGFSFLPIEGYSVEAMTGVVNMEAADADPDLGPVILMIGAENKENWDLKKFYDQFAAKLDPEIQIKDQQLVEVDGVTGLEVRLSGKDREGRDLEGRAVFLLVNPQQSFAMMGTAPSQRWQNELAPLYEGVLSSVQFFDLTEGTGR